jgi:hypothetical protein
LDKELQLVKNLLNKERNEKGAKKCIWIIQRSKRYDIVNHKRERGLWEYIQEKKLFC